MDKRKTYFYCSLLLTLFAVILLVSGSSLLTINLIRGSTIPLGTLTTWVGMISLPLMIYWGVKELREPTSSLNKMLSRILKVVIIFGLFWGPISYLLAGNFSFSFSDKQTFQGGQAAMLWFWRVSYGIGIGAILTVIAYWFSLLFKK